MLDTEITDVITPTDDVREGDELAFAPEFQATLRARYEWDLSSGLVAHVMPYATYSDKSFSDIIVINRDEIDSWFMMGVTAGVSSDSWTAELFVDNLTDEQAELSRNFVYDRQRVTLARPLNGGIRVTYDF
jgi:outer membrane receptor protein involved in Fe transport